RWAGTVVPYLAEVVSTLTAPVREGRRSIHPLGERARGRSNPPQNPVNPQAGGRVGVFAHQREGLRASRRGRPFQRWRDVWPVTRMLRRNVTARRDGGTLQLECHRQAPAGAE